MNEWMRKRKRMSVVLFLSFFSFFLEQSKVEVN